MFTEVCYLKLKKIQSLFLFLISQYCGQFWSIVLLFYTQHGMFCFKSEGHVYYGLNSLDCFLVLNIEIKKQLMNICWFLWLEDQNIKELFEILS